MNTHNDAPPAYSQQDPSHLAVPSAVDHSSAAQQVSPRHRRSSSAGSVASSNYTSEDDRDGSAIPDEARQSILDEQRPLPEGWRREFDANSGHYFYVDTLANPPRSIWSHPLDPEYLHSHPEVAKKYAPPAGPPPGVSSSSPGQGHGDEKHSPLPPHSSHSPSSSHQPNQASTSHQSHGDKKDDRTLGRKLKDKLTGTTHDQRVAQRQRQREAEQKQYEAYLARRKEILRAQAEGRYRPMYAAPAGPYARPMYGGYGGYGYGGGYGRYGGSMGMGYGGMGTGMALGGGLLGGMLLGDMLF